MSVVRRLGVSGEIELRAPINRQALAYWEGKRAGRAMPAREDVEPAEMVDFLPYVFLLDVKPSPLDFRYRLIGTIMDEHMRARYTGMWMSQIPHQRPPSVIFASCAAVVETRVPCSSDTPYVGKNKDFMRTEDIILPLSDDGAQVNMLLVTAAFL